jgi:AbrB family looped-hinge helix DNA binding protein
MEARTKNKPNTCCAPGMEGMAGMAACCRIEAIVSIDERGQMVLPKDLREKAGIKAGDKLAVVSWDKDGKSCCLVLMKTNEISGMVKNMLGPLSKEIFG